ncbi:hypothetical protein [Streptomyces sp. NPDC046859]|uniref:hypothetical protein n=1 Tax=Streptomyces sp. NPDC046859 TaxID=3155734 RepID=UPI0033EDAB76
MVRSPLDPRDNRPRVLEPAPAGRVEVMEQDRRASAVAAALLEGLGAARRAELTGAA